MEILAVLSLTIALQMPMECPMQPAQQGAWVPQCWYTIGENGTMEDCTTCAEQKAESQGVPGDPYYLEALWSEWDGCLARFMTP